MFGNSVSSEALSSYCHGLFSHLPDRDTRTFNSHSICRLWSLPTQRLRVASNTLWHLWPSLPTLLLPSYQMFLPVCYQHILDSLLSDCYYMTSPNCYNIVTQYFIFYNLMFLGSSLALKQMIFVVVQKTCWGGGVLCLRGTYQNMPEASPHQGSRLRERDSRLASHKAQEGLLMLGLKWLHYIHNGI